MARDSAVKVVGYNELRRGLKDADAAFGPELAKGNRELARWLAPLAQQSARSMGGVQAHFASAIRGFGSQTGARLSIDREANAAFWGAKKRSGWNAGNETPNQPPWVGQSWEPGGAGGPYAINPTIASHIDQIVQRYGDMVDDLTHRAFPGGT